MNCVDLQLERIANGYLVDLQMDKPLTKGWFHQEYYCPTLDDALIKLRDVADAVATYGPNIKDVLKIEPEN